MRDLVGGIVRQEFPDPLKLLEVIVKYAPIKGKVTLHRIVSDLERKGVSFGYKFINYSFGPYSRELEEDLRMLVKLGLVVLENDGDSVVIKPTKKGLEVGKSLGNIRRGFTAGIHYY